MIGWYSQHFIGYAQHLADINLKNLLSIVTRGPILTQMLVQPWALKHRSAAVEFVTLENNNGTRNPL